MVRGFTAILITLLAGTVVVLFLDLRGRADADRASEERVRQLMAEIDDLANAKRDLEAQLAEGAARIESLSEANANAVRAIQQHEAKPEPAAANADSRLADDSKPPRPRAGLELVDNADALNQSLLERGDLVGWIDMLLDLLTLGEPGYAKAVELLGRVSPRDPEFRALWRDEELLIGRMFAVLDDSVGDVLDFGLYLAEREPESLPEDVRRLRDELVYDEMATVLLGYYGAGDQRLLDEYTSMYRGLLFAPQGQGVPNHKARDVVRSLANIPTESALDVLVECIELDSVDLQTVVQAIGLHGSSRALPILQQLERDLDEGRERETVRAAIRYLSDR